MDKYINMKNPQGLVGNGSFRLFLLDLLTLGGCFFGRK